jgi:hypothetical protein
MFLLRALSYEKERVTSLSMTFSTLLIILLKGPKLLVINLRASMSDFLSALVAVTLKRKRARYWSDYKGTDANEDGIGDTPYVIDANNTDYPPFP